MLIADHSKTTLKSVAAVSSKMLVPTYQSKWCHIPHHQHLNHHPCDNLKSWKVRITVCNYDHLYEYQFGHIFLLFCCKCICVCDEQLSLFNTTAPSHTHTLSFLVLLFPYHLHQFPSFCKC